ncbi:hypothetical protein [Pengzhenrongella sicca]|uniref:Uncharacterized protein n=1 Tax=Pengzhenrongella sicca TaxID=2819238 RepID=A0A8A4ZDZ2_9MICO|nr:hypothetical protein [Pengzhenrongella sicca]QTE27918.1 hypothetical protein J4E96_10885 [Pengzhenrongella sicca]
MPSTRTDVAADPRPLTPSMRLLLVVAGVLVLLAGVQLFVFSARTDRYFAWTIAEPLTAATLGAAYWSSATIELIAARSRLWVQARIAVPTVLVFTTVTLVVTLVHLDAFHLDGALPPATRAVTWGWLAIYALVPIALGWLWVAQTRVPGSNPPRQLRLPGWLAVLAAAQAAVLLPLGAWLLLDPVGAAPGWPWPLTPLTARALGAWALSLGVAAVHSLLERDPTRLRPAAVASIALAVLQGVALARYGDAVRWGEPAAAGYLAFLAVAFVTGVGTLRAAARAPRRAVLVTP